jgi:serine/threonine protein kinase HipA of HipAB toxin-antitoxin module
MSRHLDGTVKKFLKLLRRNGFVTTMSRNGVIKIGKDGQPFYTFHVSAKGIAPAKDWIFKEYNIDLRDKPKKNLTKREQRSNLNERLQMAERRMRVMEERYEDLVAIIKEKYEDVYEELIWNKQ